MLLNFINATHELHIFAQYNELDLLEQIRALGIR